MATAFAPNWS